jgi:hypothetical protein
MVDPAIRRRHPGIADVSEAGPDIQGPATRQGNTYTSIQLTAKGRTPRLARYREPEVMQPESRSDVREKPPAVNRPPQQDPSRKTRLPRMAVRLSCIIRPTDHPHQHRLHHPLPSPSTRLPKSHPPFRRQDDDAIAVVDPHQSLSADGETDVPPRHAGRPLQSLRPQA